MRGQIWSPEHWSNSSAWVQVQVHQKVWGVQQREPHHKHTPTDFVEVGRDADLNVGAGEGGAAQQPVLQQRQQLTLGGGVEHHTGAQLSLRIRQLWLATSQGPLDCRNLSPRQGDRQGQGGAMGIFSSVFTQVHEQKSVIADQSAM